MFVIKQKNDTFMSISHYHWELEWNSWGQNIAFRAWSPAEFQILT